MRSREKGVVTDGDEFLGASMDEEQQQGPFGPWAVTISFHIAITFSVTLSS